MTMITWPSLDWFDEAKEHVPKEWYYDVNPDAVIYPRWLTPAECDAIVEAALVDTAHIFPKCGAETTEMSKPLTEALSPLKDAALMTNATFYKYDVNPESATAWMQTYKEGNRYSLHTDGIPGQTRKLTAVLMLTNPGLYSGGDLILRTGTKELHVPKTQGTVAVYPPWLHHEVTEIRSGLRRTINLGYWGPPFK